MTRVLKSRSKQLGKRKVNGHKKRLGAGKKAPAAGASNPLGPQTGAALERSINQAIDRGLTTEACQLADTYVSLYQDRLGYDQYVMLGELFMADKQYVRAHSFIMKALKIDSDRVDAPETLFWIYLKMGNLARANDALGQLIRFSGPDHEQKYASWEVLLGNTESDPDRVLESLERAGGPPSPGDQYYHEIMYSYLQALSQKGDTDRAWEILESIPEEIKNQTPNLPVMAGTILHAAGDNEGAVAKYTEAFERFNQLPEARWNRALSYLELGQLDRGWDDWLYRFDWTGFPSPNVTFDIPEWSGESLEGKSIVLWAEQGLGDQIMFTSLAVPWIKDPSIDVILAVHEKLFDLMRAWFPDARVEKLLKKTAVDHPVFSGADYHLSIGSLPPYFMRSVEQIRNRPARFLRSDPGIRETILETEGWSADSVLVGICWRSAVVDVSRSVHYVNVNLVESLRNNLPQNVKFVSLQYQLTDEEREKLLDLGVHIPGVEFFDEVLAHGRFVGACDYVVTPLTLTNQLAGIFDVPTITWTPSPGNWSFLGQREYPWYRSIAVLMLSRDHSRSSLVYQIGRWLNLAIENDV